MFTRVVVARSAPAFDGTMSVLAARSAIDELVRRGVDVAPVLARAHLSGETLLGSGEERLPHRSVGDLWEAAARAAGDRSFSVHAAERLPQGSFGLCDYLPATAATVGAGIAAATTHARLIDDGAEWQLDGARLIRRVLVQSAQLDELLLTWLLVRGPQASGA